MVLIAESSDEEVRVRGSECGEPTCAFTAGRDTPERTGRAGESCVRPGGEEWSGRARPTAATKLDGRSSDDTRACMYLVAESSGKEIRVRGGRVR